jgi:arsenate reductase
MAHGYLQSFDKSDEIHSAGTHPGSEVNANAIKVMAETGIDISKHFPKNVEKYINDHWDYVITVCDDANETCPIFPGIVKHRMHMGFQDPSKATGSEDYVMNEFRRVRDEIKFAFYDFYLRNIRKEVIKK